MRAWSFWENLSNFSDKSLIWVWFSMTCFTSTNSEVENKWAHLTWTTIWWGKFQSWLSKCCLFFCLHAVYVLIITRFKPRSLKYLLRCWNISVIRNKQWQDSSVTHLGSSRCPANLEALSWLYWIHIPTLDILIRLCGCTCQIESFMDAL